MSAAPEMVPHSYAPEDVTFLLKSVTLRPTEVAEKERRIQTGQAHYSEMISQEHRPDASYMQIFEDAFARHTRRLGQDMAALAGAYTDEPRAIVLCSLVRAGVPYGVLLRRALAHLGREVHHYAVSIIRDRGLDEVAMAHIQAEHPGARIVFVDGWTGKGAISTQLTASWGSIAGTTPEFVTLADPSGFATLSASREDWLIPSGILGANVSGLVSRSILNADVIGPGDFHGAIPVPTLADIDRTRAYVDGITPGMLSALGTVTPAKPDAERGAMLRAKALACIDKVAATFDISNRNRIKPGIAEATRALLRRRPYRVLLAERQDTDLDGIRHLANISDIDIDYSPDLTGPYKAITLIEKLGP